MKALSLQSLMAPALARHARVPAFRARLAASPAQAACWPQVNLDLPAGVSPTAPLGPVDLLAGLPFEAWWPRNQAGRPTCVAEAATACIELQLALAGPAAFPRLSPRFVDDCLRARRPVEGSATEIPVGSALAKLGEAARILWLYGVCAGAKWDDVMAPQGQLPDAVALGDASRRCASTACYIDQPPGSPRSAILARRIHAELAARRPVAIALPGFRNRQVHGGDTSWDRAENWFTGHIPDPGPEDVAVPDSGHAVCLVGFQPDATEPKGGHFVFRNSWGLDFGQEGRRGWRPPGPPRIPARGFGTISASHVEAATWEVLSFTMAEAA